MLKAQGISLGLSFKMIAPPEADGLLPGPWDAKLFRSINPGELSVRIIGSLVLPVPDTVPAGLFQRGLFSSHYPAPSLPCELRLRNLVPPRIIVIWRLKSL